MGFKITEEELSEMIKDVIRDVNLLVLVCRFIWFSGQKFIKDILAKISKARTMINKIGKKVYLEVDGGIMNENHLC